MSWPSMRATTSQRSEAGDEKYEGAAQAAGQKGDGAAPRALLLLRVCAAEDDDDADEDLAEEHVTKVRRAHAVAEGRSRPARCVAYARP